ncbi:hypothetical protein RDV64_22090 [Acuticoccus sp. MNP-M23]|uniref:hypothetical protein n=1 Tax=Acuticoccus sp. MNP-M23 TaxID=3072793 RepID=UPI0028157CF6|nr:hypothetical protein [Acuticoccus sp. MNP-M23]WMS42712.1 hypothetical protein RDV64_22090 [Acuticoccus sp. MNP-M23]
MPRPISTLSTPSRRSAENEAILGAWLKSCGASEAAASARTERDASRLEAQRKSLAPFRTGFSFTPRILLPRQPIHGQNSCVQSAAPARRPQAVKLPPRVSVQTKSSFDYRNLIEIGRKFALPQSVPGARPAS